MLKEKIKESEGSLSQKECMWRNVIFDKNGKSYKGKKLWDTSTRANDAMKNALEACQRPNSPPYTGWGLPTEEGVLHYEDYAWHMQIPILN